MRAGAGVGLVHLILGYALITGLATQVVHKVSGALKTFDVAAAPPAPPIDPAEADAKAAEGEASPANLHSRVTPVVAPPPKIRIKVPPPILAAPKPAPVPGSDATAGSAVPGPGSGSGGIGNGPGSGGAGPGSGSGGAARAVRTGGRLDNSDYPRSALRSGAEGTVSVRYTVGTNGRVSACSVTRSSGHAELDGATCRLIELRFRYRPARDRSGAPVAETVRKTFDWILPFKARPVAP
jgi:protein TonB